MYHTEHVFARCACPLCNRERAPVREALAQRAALWVGAPLVLSWGGEFSNFASIPINVMCHVNTTWCPLLCAFRGSGVEGDVRAAPLPHGAGDVRGQRFVSGIASPPKRRRAASPLFSLVCTLPWPPTRQPPFYSPWSLPGRAVVPPESHWGTRGGAVPIPTSSLGPSS